MDDIFSGILALGIISVFAFFGYYVFKTYFAPKKLEQIAAMIKDGNLGPAIRRLITIIEEDERNIYAHYLLAEAYRMEKKNSEAILQYKKILRAGRFNSKVKEEMIRSKLGSLYLQLENLDDAKKEFLILTKLEPTNGDHFYQVGKLFQNAGVVDKASTYFKQAAKVNPTHADAFLNDGVISFQQGNVMEARTALVQAVKLNPNHYEGHYYLGLCLKGQKDYEWAVKEFDQAMQKDSLKSKAYLAKGLCYLEQDHFAKAIVSLEHGLGSAQKGSEAELNLRYFIGLSSEKLRDLHTAIAHWEAIMESNPKFRDVSVRLKSYEEYRTEDTIKDFMIASSAEFEQTCKKLVDIMDLNLLNLSVENDTEVHALATESETKWRNTKLSNRLVYIFRVTSPIQEKNLRDMHEHMRKTNATKGVCLTAGTFTSQAEMFCQSRPIDLIDKTGMIRLLRQVS